jgi:hypothetical protein
MWPQFIQQLAVHLSTQKAFFPVTLMRSYMSLLPTIVVRCVPCIFGSELRVIESLFLCHSLSSLSLLGWIIHIDTMASLAACIDTAALWMAILSGFISEWCVPSFLCLTQSQCFPFLVFILQFLEI